MYGVAGCAAARAKRCWLDVIAFSGVKKSFAGAVAVDDVTVNLPDHALSFVLGENGAGKSTLLRCAAGLLRPDRGAVAIDGAELTEFTPREATRRGVAMVEQHFSLIGDLTAIENVVLGLEPSSPFGRIDWPLARMKAKKALDELGFNVDLDSRVERLDVGDKQRLEIARALYRDARVIVLDEPTAVLTPQETTSLYDALLTLVSRGRSIVVVSHKLDEVVKYGARAIVLRRGKLVKEFDFTSAPYRSLPVGSLAELSSAMMGREGAATRPRIGRTALGPVLCLSHVCVPPRLHDATIEIRAGEIVGLAGVEGNGQQELLEAIGGLTKPSSGTIAPSDVAMVYGDRNTEGLVMDASVEDNLLLGDLGQSVVGIFIDETDARRRAEAIATSSAIAPHDVTSSVGALSGGNQQKVVVARALHEVERGAKALVIAHPTRGVDVEAAASLWEQIERATETGVATLVLSADLNELRTHCDRIAILSKGRIVGTYEPTLSDEEFGVLMLGGGT